MKYYVVIIPLLCLTIGAFFLDWKANVIILSALLIFVVITRRDLFLKAILNTISLFAFTLPILLIKIFTSSEGKKISFFFIDIYSSGIYQSVNSISRIFILGLVSFIILKIIFPNKLSPQQTDAGLPFEPNLQTNDTSVNQNKTIKNHIIFDIFFLSIEIYQGMLSGFILYFREKGNKKALLDYIDKIYYDGIK